MEDRHYDPNEEDTSPDRPAAPKRDGESVFRAWLRKFEFSEPSNETDDEEESETQPPKRRWRLFKGFFASMVDKSESDTEVRDKPSVAENPLGWNAIQSTEYVADSVKEESTNQRPAVENEFADELRTDGLPTSESTTAALPLETTPAVHETPEVETDTQAVNSSTETVPNMRYPRNTEYRQQRDAPATETIQEERVIERGVGMALPVVLVGAEYLGRKRADRKIKRDVIERTEALKKEIERNALARQQLETLVRQNREQVQTLKQERGITPEASLSRPSNPERPKPLKQEVITPVVEKTPELQPKHGVNPEVRQKPDERQEAIVPHPEIQKVIEKEASRTEHMIERSHEIKDEPAAVSSSPAVSIGNIVANKPQVSVRQVPQAGPVTNDDQTGLPVLTDEQTAAYYRQAIKMGFWSAIIIIILGILAYLVVK